MDYTDVIFERTLHKIKGAVKIEIDFETTSHSDERKFRHEGIEIDDKEIVETCRKAIGKITTDLFLDKISMRDELVIQDAKTDMNVVCQLRGPRLDALKLVIITVMIKKNFRPKSGTIPYSV